ncbi:MULTISPECIES: hypothetical protein [Vibrio]|uniref:hypothetical protein n=1 Tax=Vibrio TaxID=662 RepID=UPI0011211A00|nr:MULTISPECIES: hypothetical protein [Vibrio]EGR1564746.1 hypothetical protein [Vibrio alginolyticus]EJG0029200.1 hypothetical protein [Vibrio alginolyticus]ELA7357917.1 hypothetical protein [Vibrio alginolyticus]EMA2429617.1 hypothetical protein [Vibrio alginolyticus]MBS9875245.1 hypothetical protein [Vibrio alginolyticus]
MEEISLKLDALEKEHYSLAEYYEHKGSYEMSYVALWTVLEHIMKPIASIGVKKKLESELLEWVNHIQKPTPGKQPKEIKNFKTEYKATSIPPMTLIEEAIGELPKLRVLMDSKGKYRRKRNDIAHRAEKLSEASYLDYKESVLAAVIEVKQRLRELEERT